MTNGGYWIILTRLFFIKRFLLNFKSLNFRDNDRSSLNCASMLKGGWWWKSCGRGLNGVYLTNPQDLAARQGNKIRISGVESLGVGVGVGVGRFMKN